MKEFILLMQKFLSVYYYAIKIHNYACRHVCMYNRVLWIVWSLKMRIETKKWRLIHIANYQIKGHNSKTLVQSKTTKSFKFYRNILKMQISISMAYIRNPLYTIWAKMRFWWQSLSLCRYHLLKKFWTNSPFYCR